MFLQYGVGGHVLAANLELKVKIVSEHNQNHFITCVMPELTGNDTSFAFLSSLYQEKSLFHVFDMASAAILGRHFEFESQDRLKI